VAIAILAFGTASAALAIPNFHEQEAKNWAKENFEIGLLTVVNGRYYVDTEKIFPNLDEKTKAVTIEKIMNRLRENGILDELYLNESNLIFVQSDILKRIEQIGLECGFEARFELQGKTVEISPDFRIAEISSEKLQIGNYIFESSPYFPDWQTVEINAPRVSSTDYQMGKYFGIMPYFVDNGAVFLPYISTFDGGMLYNRYSNFFMPFYFYTLGGVYYAYPSGGFTYCGSKLFLGFQPADYQGLQIQYGNFVRDQSNFFGKISVSGDGNEKYFSLTKDFYNTQTKEKVDVFDYPNAVKTLRYAVLPYSESPTNDEIILDAVRNSIPLVPEKDLEQTLDVPHPPISDTIDRGIDAGIVAPDPKIEVGLDGEVFVDDVPLDLIAEDFPAEEEEPRENINSGEADGTLDIPKIDTDLVPFYDKFPFSLPFDLHRIFTIFVYPERKPAFEIPIKISLDFSYANPKTGKIIFSAPVKIDEKLTLDLTYFSIISKDGTKIDIAQILIKTMFYVIFVVFLIKITPKIMM
jgi:hypothetical protein